MNLLAVCLKSQVIISITKQYSVSIHQVRKIKHSSNKNQKTFYLRLENIYLYFRMIRVKLKKSALTHSSKSSAMRQKETKRIKILSMRGIQNHRSNLHSNKIERK